VDSSDLIELGVAIVEDAERQGAELRLLGGVAVAVLCADVWKSHPALRRTPNDIDLAGYSRQSAEIERLLLARGFAPAKEFNFLNAGRRLIFFRESDGVKIDIFLDEFRMCHRLSWAGRLESAPPALAPADLLLTKLQIVEFTQRDSLDCYAILLQCSGDQTGKEAAFLEVERIVRICSADWGWYRTLMGNLIMLIECPPSQLEMRAIREVCSSLKGLRESIENCKKTALWRLRALAGERWRWYDSPEEPTFRTYLQPPTNI
jgi:hypothetical protein